MKIRKYIFLIITISFLGCQANPENLKYENGKVIVTGCLSKADSKLEEKFPNLLSVSGPQQYDTVVKAVQLPNSSGIEPLIRLPPTQNLVS